MHRIVIFSQLVVDNGEVLYGKLYSGETEDKLIASAAADLKRLLIQEQFVGQQGEEWRQQEGWILVKNNDGTESWRFDNDKYTNYMGYGIIVDQFVEHCWIPPTCLDELYGVWNNRRPVRRALLDSPDVSWTGQQMGSAPDVRLQ